MPANLSVCKRFLGAQLETGLIHGMIWWLAELVIHQLNMHMMILNLSDHQHVRVSKISKSSAVNLGAGFWYFFSGWIEYISGTCWINIEVWFNVLFLIQFDWHICLFKCNLPWFYEAWICMNVYLMVVHVSREASVMSYCCVIAYSSSHLAIICLLDSAWHGQAVDSPGRISYERERERESTTIKMTKVMMLLVIHSSHLHMFLFIS